MGQFEALQYVTWGDSGYTLPTKMGDVSPDVAKTLNSHGGRARQT